LEIIVTSVLAVIKEPALRSATYVRNGITNLKNNEAVAHVGEPQYNKDHVVMLNGVFNLKTHELTDRSPDLFVTTRVSFPYLETTECNSFMKFIYEFCSHHEDRVQFIRSFLYALVHSRVDLQVFLYLLGPGGTGKSVLASLATALIGKEATLTTSLKSLQLDPFELTNIRGKKLILISDTEYYKGSFMNTLKALVGNDALKGRVKYIQGSNEISPEGLVMIVGNYPLGVRDTSNAIIRRMRSLVAPLGGASFHSNLLQISFVSLFSIPRIHHGLGLLV
jgi:phage/plasmid-associated DNA primase